MMKENALAGNKRVKAHTISISQDHKQGRIKLFTPTSTTLIEFIIQTRQQERIGLFQRVVQTRQQDNWVVL